jgi:flavin-dependent dehydrogenase
MVFYIYGQKIPLKTRQFGIRRIEFDDWLLRRSESPILRHPVRTIRLEKEYYIIDNTYRCKYLVGAGGTHCPVYTSLFSNSNPRKQTNHIITIEEEFPYKYQDDRCFLWMMENGLPGYSWYFPKGDGYLNVGIGAKYESLKRRNESIHIHWDLLIKKLDKLKLVNSYQYKPRGYSYYIRHRAINLRYGNSFIVGDRPDWPPGIWVKELALQ